MTISYEYGVFQILLYAETLKILYMFSHWKGSEFGTDVNGDVTVFSKEQPYSLLLSTHPPGYYLFAQFIFVDSWMDYKSGVFKERKEHTYPNCSVSRIVWLAPITKKEKNSPLPVWVASAGESKWKPNPGNLIKTKVDLVITCLSPHQALKLKNKLFHLLEKTY